MGDHVLVLLTGDPHPQRGYQQQNRYSRCGLLPISDPVRPRARVLRELIRDSLYVVDERAVAGAIVARAVTRQLVAEPTFRSDGRGPQARSFRRDPRARSFRLSNGTSLRRIGH
jgi:hypothetical protein